MKSLFKKIIVSVLTLEARIVLYKYQPKVIAITGSVGKTSTKDAIYTLFAKEHHARKSEKSFNSELGVPLTILGLPNAWSSVVGWLENIMEGLHLIVFTVDYPEWLVLEVGADRPGDIKNLQWLKPHIVVLTRFPDVPVHVEYFESPEEVIQEKLELLKALRPKGTLIFNADDEKMQNLPHGEEHHVLSYGLGEGAHVRGHDVQVMYEDGRPAGLRCPTTFQNEHADLVLRGTIGQHHAHTLLAALAVGLSEGMVFQSAVETLSTHVPPPGRMRVLHGIKQTVLIDDTYNASPVAVEAGLNVLPSIDVPGKKIVVLGDMMELGDYSMAEHTRVGEHVALVADVFVAVGVRMRAAGEAATAAEGMCTRVESVQDTSGAVTLLKDLVEEGDVVYLKGSQSMRMERAVEALLLDSAEAVMDLVRQDKEWKKKK